MATPTVTTPADPVDLEKLAPIFTASMQKAVASAGGGYVFNPQHIRDQIQAFVKAWDPGELNLGVDAVVAKTKAGDYKGAYKEYLAQIYNKMFASRSVFNAAYSNVAAVEANCSNYGTDAVFVDTSTDPIPQDYVLLQLREIHREWPNAEFDLIGDPKGPRIILDWSGIEVKQGDNLKYKQGKLFCIIEAFRLPHQAGVRFLVDDKDPRCTQWGTVHVHIINQHQLCVGDAQEQFVQLFKLGALYEIAKVTHQIITEPHHSIGDYNPQCLCMCDECKEWVPVKSKAVKTKEGEDRYATVGGRYNVDAKTARYKCKDCSSLCSYCGQDSKDGIKYQKKWYCLKCCEPNLDGANLMPKNKMQISWAGSVYMHPDDVLECCMSPKLGAGKAVNSLSRPDEGLAAPYHDLMVRLPDGRGVSVLNLDLIDLISLKEKNNGASQERPAEYTSEYWFKRIKTLPKWANPGSHWARLWNKHHKDKGVVAQAAAH